jgi:hypothetical protein
VCRHGASLSVNRRAPCTSGRRSALARSLFTFRARQAVSEMNGEALVSARDALQDPSTVNDKRP